MGDNDDLECPKHGTHDEWAETHEGRLVCGKCIMDFFVSNFPSYDADGKNLRVPTISSYAHISWK